MLYLERSDLLPKILSQIGWHKNIYYTIMKEEQKADALLKFNKGGNAKLDKDIVTFSLPSGYTCPGADTCLAKVDLKTGKIIDGPNQTFRCFSAVSELRPAVRLQRWHNLILLKAAKTKDAMVQLISDSFPRGTKILRIHVGGDFFSQTYLDAWIEVAKKFHHCVFYAYTKSIPFVTARKNEIPSNLRITLSKGGKFDSLIDKELESMTEEEGMQYGIAEVLGHPEEALDKQLEIDHDDSHAISGRKHFALLLHSQQPAGSGAAKKIKRMRSEKIQFSYPSKTKTS